MATQAQSAFNQILVTADQAWQSMLVRFVTQTVQAILIDYDRRDGNSDDHIAPENQRAVTEAITSALFALFVYTSANGFAVFSQSASGAPQPRTPFAQILWNAERAAMQIAVDEQARILRTRLARYPDVIRQLERARLNPFDQMAQLPVDVRRVLMRYELPIESRRADGRALTERVVIASVEARRRLTALLSQLFAEGATANAIVDTLRTYYTTGFRNERPNGVGKLGSYENRRLLMSEPVYARSMASIAGAALNPFITEVYIRRTRNRPCPICDEIVKGNPYTLTDAPLPGFHSHCACQYVFRTRGDTASVVARMRDNGLLDVKGALSPDFLTILQRHSMGAL